MILFSIAPSPNGISYLIFGSETIVDTTTITLSQLTNIFTITGTDPTISYNSGYAVSVVGDINQDGMTDILIGKMISIDEIMCDI